LRYQYEIELKIWKILNRIKNSTPIHITEEEINYGIEKAEERQGFPYTDQQKEVIRNSTKNNLTIVTGRAGVGKTSIARGILNVYGCHSIGACALSAKAAKRITEVSGFSATTIHRMLGAKGINDFSYNEYNPLDFDVVFLDESSMVNSSLFYYLIRALKSGSKLILSGDSAQLSPISWGNPFADILSKDLEINYLTKILRQSERSGIIQDANLVREGIDPLNGQKSFKSVSGELQDLVYMFRSDKNELRDIAIKTYLKTIQDPNIGIDNCYILTMRKENAINSTREINKIIQNKLIDKDTLSMKHGEHKEFRLGARVIHTVNDYLRDTYNGDMGTVSGFGKDDEGDFMEVDYGDKTTIYHKENLNELELAYCLTTHKFQGSEARIILGLIDNAAFMLLDRTALYTMLTRGKEKVLLLAEPYAFDRAIYEDHSGSRNTWTQYFN
jgi:exodeoxyribonuclease V alpha subunit